MFKNLLVFFMLVGVTAFGQEVQISGTVTAKDDASPLPGVSIYAKGTKKGVTSDANGKYSLSVSKGSQVIFSYVGFEPTTVTVGSQSIVNVQLETGANVLEEVIATAFGTAKKASFTGSSAVINADAIATRPVTSVLQVLAGAAPGIQSNMGSGQPGASPNIRVRGFGSVSASNNPLYVVDGMPLGVNINNINPSDIESVTVLKDAASTALYGARAANGVVLITTKKGRDGKNNIDLSYTKGNNSRGIPEYERVGAADYYTLMWEANRNSLAYRQTNPVALATAGTTATNGLGALVGYNVFDVPFNQLVSPEGVFNPNAKMIYDAEEMNWEKPLIAPNSRDEMNLKFSGGANKSDYLISLGYLSDKGFLVNSDFKRYTLRLNVNTQLKPFFKTGLNVNGGLTDSNSGQDGTNTAFVNPFFFSRNMAPIYPVYAINPAAPGQFLLDADGKRIYDIGNMSALGLPNRSQYAGRHNVYETLLNKNFFKRTNVGARAYVEFTFLKNFKFTSNLGTDISIVNSRSFGNPIVGDGAPAGSGSNEFENSTVVNFNQLLNYNNNFGKHNVDVILGHESYDEKDNRLRGSRTGQVLDGNIELINFTTTTNLDSRARDRRVEGYFSRATYDFDEKYIVTLSARRDGSSKFNLAVRWGNFYSIGTAWRIDQEKFMESLPFISNLKLRANFGETGNDEDINIYAWQPTYSLSFNNATEPGILQGSLGNLDLVWEKSTAADLGLEAGFLEDKINASVEVFQRTSSNLLFNVPLPVSSGVASQTRNIGTMYNKGIEMAASAVVYKKNDLSIVVSGNATSFINRFTKLPAETPVIVTGTKRYEEGRDIQNYWLREYMGVNPATGEALYRAAALVPANSFVRENGDTVTTNISNARFINAGSAIPKFNGGFGTSISYKGFELSGQFIYQVGGKVYDGAYAGIMGSGYHNAKSVDILKRWQKPGDITDVPRMDASRTSDFDAASTRWLLDATYFALRNVNLSYTVPTKWASKIKSRGVSFYVSGENLAFFGKRKGTNIQQDFSGVTSNTYPGARSIVFGTSLGF
ncbi:MAG TPA: SusC/RagA family TonB-linked outer membrane protein [Leadbetterella sp.]|nr:SusC/RagA family TonB-linked outer membrane protein [Leadbetterella sp.]